MIDSELEKVRQQIMSARYPEDLFGAVPYSISPDDLRRRLEQSFAELAALSDPTRYQHPIDRQAAEEAHEALTRLYERAKAHAARGFYGLVGYGGALPTSQSKTFVVGNRRYYVEARLQDDYGSSTYEGLLELEGRSMGQVTIKRAQSPKGDLFIENELRILDILHGKSVPQWKHLPTVLDRFSSAGRAGMVLQRLGGHSLTEVRSHRLHRDGVDERHMVWMLDRALSCLGYVHQCGVVHGNLTPENMRIDAASHNVVIGGWGAAAHNPAITAEQIRVFSDEFGAPEVKEQGEIGPWSDIYSLGKIMIWLLGGNHLTNQMPKGIKAPIQSFLLEMVNEDRFQRPSDAWALHAEETRIKDALWRRQFLHFDIS